jgi:hypothetical protein
MGLVVWPYVVAGSVVAIVGLWLLYRGLLGDRSRGRRRCGRCWYDMAGLETLRCPECGREARSERGLRRTRRRWWLILPGVLLLLIGGTGTSTPWLARAKWIESAPRPVLILAMYITDGPDTRLRDEFDRRRFSGGGAMSPPSPGTVVILQGIRPMTAAPPPLAQSELTWIENWCVRRIAVSVLTRPNVAAPTSSWAWRSRAIFNDARRPLDWLLWLGNDAAPAVDDLLAIAHSKIEERYRVQAIDILARLGLRKKEVIEQFLSIAKGPDAVAIRTEAIGGIGRIGDQSDRCSPGMRALLSDGVKAVRSAALSQMAMFVDRDSTLVDDLVARLPREPDGPLRHYMVSLMLHVDGRCGEMRELYEGMLRHDDHPPTRLGALFGLRICSRNVQELRGYAVEGMHDQDFCVRLAALQIVLDLGPAGMEALPSVRELRGDPNSNVAEMARTVERELGALGEK